MSAHKVGWHGRRSRQNEGERGGGELKRETAARGSDSEQQGATILPPHPRQSRGVANSSGRLAGPRRRGGSMHVAALADACQPGLQACGGVSARGARPGPARLASPRPAEVAQLGSARLGSARLSSARLEVARLGSARLKVARLGSARLGSARLGSARLGFTRHLAVL
jgi:hypothetical protein